MYVVIGHIEGNIVPVVDILDALSRIESNGIDTEAGGKVVEGHVDVGAIVDILRIRRTAVDTGEILARRCICCIDLNGILCNVLCGQGNVFLGNPLFTIGLDIDRRGVRTGSISCGTGRIRIQADMG